MKLGNREYKTKASITAECQRILKATKANTLLEGADEAFVRDLLKLYPRSGATEGCSLFVIANYKSPKYKCFAYVNRGKCTVRSFSYKECISPKPPINRFSQAARRAVEDDIIVFKQEYWRGKRSVLCPVSGVRMTRVNSHVDHAEVCFAALVDLFIREQEIDLSKVTYRGYGWSKASLVRAFVDFHRANAVLVVISASANLSKGTSGYKRSQPTAA